MTTMIEEKESATRNSIGSRMNRMIEGPSWKYNIFALAVWWKLITLKEEERKSGSGGDTVKILAVEVERVRERVVYSSNVNHITRLLNPKWKMFTELQSYKVAGFFSARGEGRGGRKGETAVLTLRNINRNSWVQKLFGEKKYYLVWPGPNR